MSNEEKFSKVQISCDTGILEKKEKVMSLIGREDEIRQLEEATLATTQNLSLFMVDVELAKRF